MTRNVECAQAGKAVPHRVPVPAEGLTVMRNVECAQVGKTVLTVSQSRRRV